MPDSSKDVRKKVLGRNGEVLTCRYLKRRGYKILERNYQTPFGEADIVAFRKGTYCFVEVKTRESDSFGQPFEAVDGRKRERYRKIAAYYCNAAREELPCRYDISSVRDGKIEYFEDAYI